MHTENLSKYSVQLENRWEPRCFFRWVHKGRYAPDPIFSGHDDGGPQNGQLCVLKEFKTGSVYEDSFFLNDIHAVRKAGEFIEAFNQMNRNPFDQPLTGDYKKVLLNQPAVWQRVDPDHTGKYSKTLVEPMLEFEFLKFNSNSGYSKGADFMQALSHFSYHHSGGKYLLCDLQGGHYEDMYVLTDPVIISNNDEKVYGATDLGSEGIGNFFAHHKCNRFCKASWLKPFRPQVSSRIPCQAGTSMCLTIGSSRKAIAMPSIADQKKTADKILAEFRAKQNAR